MDGIHNLFIKWFFKYTNKYCNLYKNGYNDLKYFLKINDKESSFL